MEISDVALRFVGAFYAFAGVVATRAAIMAAFLDAAIAKISLEKTTVRKKARTSWLFAGAVATFAGGLALAVQLEAAQWLFLISALGQAAYLAILAPFYFDVDDPPDAKGRKGTINAFALYVIATAFVLWGAQHGKLKPIAEAGPAAIAIVGTVLAAYVWYLASTAWRTLRPSPDPSISNEPLFDDGGENESQPFDASTVQRVQVLADHSCDPLWSLDGGYQNFAPEALSLSEDLARDLSEWAARYSQSLNQDDPGNSHWSDAQFREHRNEGRALAVRLKGERPDLTVFVFEPATGVVEVHDETA